MENPKNILPYIFLVIIMGGSRTRFTCTTFYNLTLMYHIFVELEFEIFLYFSAKSNIIVIENMIMAKIGA